MRYFLPLLAFALLTSCRTHTQVKRDVRSDTDFVGSSLHHRSSATLDSLAATLQVGFDTLDISLCRLEQGDTTETFRLRAVKGYAASSRSRLRLAEEAKTRLDSTAYKISSADGTAEHTATTALYNPPDTTIVVVASVALALMLLYILIRRHK